MATERQRHVPKRTSDSGPNTEHLLRIETPSVQAILEHIGEPSRLPFSPHPAAIALLAAFLGAIVTSASAVVRLDFLSFPAAFICSDTMAVTYWMEHGLNSFFPLINHGELAALYCFAFLFIAAKGAGIWSVDRLLASGGNF